MTVTAQYAAEHFEELARAAEQGLDVEIVRPGRASISLREIPTAMPRLGPFFDSQGLRVAGTGKDFLRELSVAEWDALDRSTEHILDAPLDSQST